MANFFELSLLTSSVDREIEKEDIGIVLRHTAGMKQLEGIQSI